jgi:stage IV sporulation protein FB
MRWTTVHCRRRKEEPAVFLAEPQRTQYDLHFQLLGIPVRVSPFFWVAALVLGWNLTGADGLRVLLWIAAVFLSILVHEFGHALAFRRFGISSYVVLYHFGGLAVPQSSHSSFGFGRSLNSKQQIFVSAAGPAAQLALAAVVVILVRVAGHAVPFPISMLPTAIQPIAQNLLVGNSTQIPNAPMFYLVLSILLPSVFWALLNLLPVYPLDGGQIARELFLLFNVRDGIRNSLILSIVTGAAVAVYSFSQQDVFLAIMFGLLAFSSYQVLQAYSGRGGGFGGGSPW